MKFKLKVITLCLFLFLPQIALAEEQAVVSAEQAKKIHNDLRQLRATLEKAMNEKDIKTILAHVDDNVIFTTMNGDVVTGKEKLGAYYNKMMVGPDRIIDSVQSKFIADDLSVLLEDDVAIAHGHSEDRYQLIAGKELNLTALWSSTLIHRSGGWKIASFHYSVDMFENPIVAAQQKSLWMVGAAGFLLALATFFIGRRRKKT